MRRFVRDALMLLLVIATYGGFVACGALYAWWLWTAPHTGGLC